MRYIEHLQWLSEEDRRPAPRDEAAVAREAGVVILWGSITGNLVLAADTGEVTKRRLPEDGGQGS